jgi:hypothetical protein
MEPGNGMMRGFGTAAVLVLLLIAGFTLSQAHAQAPSDAEAASPLADESAAPLTDAPTLEFDADGNLIFDETLAEEVYVDEEAYEPVATDLDAAREAHAAFLKLPGLQRERPEGEAPPEFEPPEPPNWLIEFFRFLGALGPIFKILFWVIGALVVGGILYFLFGEAIRIRFGGSGKGKVDNGDDALIDLRPDAAEARSLLEEADALARMGRFAEAVHLLLFRSINDMQKRLEGGVPRSLTAREIGDLKHVPDRARRALGPIIRIVESSFFGGRDVDAPGWQSARASYEDFAFGENWA